MMKVAILGYGIEGKSAYEYFSKYYPKYEVDVFDENSIEDKKLKVTKVNNMLDIDYSSYDMIVRSPSVGPPFLPDSEDPPFHDLYHKIRFDRNNEDNFNLTSLTKIFFDKCPAKIVGVTGSKGKGTTASFISEILKTSGKKVHLLGNIGAPALDVLPKIKKDDIVVYELSSFQLWDMVKSPHVAVVTMLEADHLEVHKDFNEYILAKMNILFWQKADDFAFMHKKTYQTFEKEYNEHSSILLAERKLDGQLTLIPRDNDWYEGLHKLAQNNPLPGEHNVRNAELAILASRAIDSNLTDEQIIEGLQNFGGLPHRLKFVAEKNGVKYYDDSIATTPGSAIAAIKSFKEHKILILGGHDKGADYGVIAGPANEFGVQKIFAIGDNREKVAKQVGEKFKGEISILASREMDDIVKTIASSARAGEVVIMSPAAASFDMFKNYKDRGEQFVDAVNKLP